MRQPLVAESRPPLSQVPRRMHSSVPISGPAVSVSPGLVGTALTLVLEILPARKAELISLLTQMGKSIDETREMDFKRLSTVHFMRWVVIDGLGAKPSLLAFESNYDGTLDEHLDDLHLHGARCMHAIYRCCAGYPLARLTLPAASDSSFQLGTEERAQATSFLKSATLPYSAFYVGRPGKSARRIKSEGAVRDAIQAFLDGHGSNPGRTFGDAAQVYDAIVEHLRAEHRHLLDEIQQEALSPPERRLAPAVLRLLGLALPLAPALLPLYGVLRFKELTDEAESYDVLPEGTRELAEREDFQVQNQLTHLVPLKPGAFRLFTLKLVLYAINTLARYYFNQGELGGLSTIHYARWVLIDGGKRLLFFSNYDGSWERYLGDFVDQAHVGLTAVWSNTHGFPKTAHLVTQGAEDEERFKAWTRAHQIPTQLWFSAYPSLTTRNIGNNSAICAGLARRPPSGEALLRWLSLL